MGVHCLAKYNLRKLAFSQKLVVRWSFNVCGGIQGIVLSLQKVFKIV